MIILIVLIVIILVIVIVTIARRPGRGDEVLRADGRGAPEAGDLAQGAAPAILCYTIIYYTIYYTILYTTYYTLDTMCTNM